ncbi:MAG: serine hydroxymethyltransferase [Weeksellaceae bacterium]
MKIYDQAVYDLIAQEENRQREGIELIPSENYASEHVRTALSSPFVNKYSEGYPKKRYYGGNEFVDDLEIIAQDRAKAIFGVPHVNVQPYSGSPANLAVYLATCAPDDTIMGQALVAGGHLTHGHNVSATGIFFKSVQYGVLDMKNADGDLFDYDAIRKIALEHKPKLIWVGATAYPLIIKYDKFAAIAEEVGAYLAADIAHVAGLIAGGAHPSPVEHVHIVTTTTHKTLRGPRGAMIMVTEKGLAKDPDLAKKIDKAVFPGLQGGPHDNQTAAIAIALYEAQQPEFKNYAHQIVKNSQTLAATLMKGGLKVVGDTSENHLILVDLTDSHGLGTGMFAEFTLDLAGLTLNKNTIPGEKSSPFYPSGIRLGTPAATTRGMKEKEMQFIGEKMIQVLNHIKDVSLPTEKVERLAFIKEWKQKMREDKTIAEIHEEVKKVAVQFPLP